MKKRRVLYIVSPGFSGSTLLNLLLATHPDVATIGERTYIDRQTRGLSIKYCSCGQTVHDCDFLKSALEAGLRRLPWYLRKADYPSFQFSRNRRINKRFRRATNRYISDRDPSVLIAALGGPHRAMCEANAALVDFVLESASASVFLDSSKSTAELSYLMASELFDITPIHLSRDGRGQFYSSLIREPDVSPENAALRFRHWIKRIEKVLDDWDGPYVRLKYEDLCEHPLREIRRIAEETGLDPDGMSLDYLNVAPHIIGNDSVVRAKSREISDKELWRTELSADHLAIFEELAGDANRSLGYGV